MGHFLIVTTIYASLIAYLFAVLFWVSGRRSKGYRVLWTTGCVSLWAHAVFAFHFHHNWSHAHAVQLTAERTEAVIGYAYGDGIWFSYLLLLLWLIDVVQLWRISFPGNANESDVSQSNNSSESHQSADRSSAWSYFSFALHAYAFFILFNGTVVFEEGAVRWAGIIGTFWIARMAWRFRRVPFSTAQTAEL